MRRIVCLVALLGGPALGQQPPSYDITLSFHGEISGKRVADFINGLANSDIPASIALPLMRSLNGQVAAQNQAAADAAAKAAQAAEAAKKPADQPKPEATEPQ